MSLLPLTTFAEPVLWQDLSEASGGANAAGGTVPSSYRAVRLNNQLLTQLLANVPLEFTEAARRQQVVITIPMPDGSLARFRVQESPISLPDPSGKVSDFRSYSGQGLDDPSATLRFDVSSAGFHAQILSKGETVYIDPHPANAMTDCISYYRRDSRAAGPRPPCLAAASDFFNSSGADKLGRRANDGFRTAGAANGATLHQFRTAVAATGEYTTFFRQAGDSDEQAKARALAAIKTTMNRVNGIWERDLAIRYVLVSDADELRIIYTDPANDPYTNQDPNKASDENQANLDAQIGDANYHIGHVFATSAGGVGGGGVCIPGQKAIGATGLDRPTGDPFDVDLVAHELIHQWQGGHTFNESASGECNPANRTPGSAYEPGSGSTLASYAGTCGPANLQANSDDYFHSGSIGEILAFRNSTATCAIQTATGNNPPNVTAPASFTIPRNTPFTLTGTANDPDGDALTHGWEEFDLGNPSPPNTDDGTRPLFRPYRPVSSPSRTFPSLQYILNNANNPPANITVNGQTYLTGEVMPTTTRTMKFRLIVRDNRAGGGGINDATTEVNVRAESGPFVITAPNSAASFSGGSQVTVSWDVANTNAPPVNATQVKISLSTDGGNAFSTVLAGSTPNDGSEPVTLPNVSANNARIKVEAVGNIFFDISDTNFSITGAGPVERTLLGNISTRMRVETGDNALIGGIIITGSQPKKIIVRAIGPSLNVGGNPLPNRLENPQLQLFDANQNELVFNNNWKDAPNRQEIIDSTVAPTHDSESAILTTLQPGNYTAVVRGVSDTTGIGVAEIYDLDRNADSKLANISTRGFVQTGDNVMIGGFIVLGQTSQKVIIRAIGPSLKFEPKLANPTLELVDRNANRIRFNDNWKSDQEPEIRATGIPPEQDLESAIVETLAPADYTAIVRGASDSTGIAVVEVYALQ